MKHSYTAVVLLLIGLLSSPLTYSHDCKTDLAETMRALKDSMKVIGKSVRRGDKEALEDGVDTAILYLDESRELFPEGFVDLEGDALTKAKAQYIEQIDQLEMLLEQLPSADKQQARDVLQSIKDLQKKSHKKFKNC